MKQMPKKILLYVCDHEQDGTPILAVATKLDEIPEDCNGGLIGEYQLATQSKLTVKRELIPLRN